MPTPTHILFVDSEAHLDGALSALAQLEAQITVANSFRAARQMLLESPPNILISNVRLGAYNGIQLALMAAAAEIPTIIYAREHDLVLARDAQAVGAFYIRWEQLPAVLPSFLTAGLPGHDRRDPAVLDRRRTPRGGRRATDAPAAVDPAADSSAPVKTLES